MTCLTYTLEIWIKEAFSIGVVVSCMDCGRDIMCAWWRASLIVLGMDFDCICLWLRFGLVMDLDLELFD
jgi:hypothetical protein